MKESQLKEIVQKHVDDLFLSLKDSLGIEVAENVKSQFCQRLCKEALTKERKILRESVFGLTCMTFSKLEKELELTFNDDTKAFLQDNLLVAVGLSGDEAEEDK